MRMLDGVFGWFSRGWLTLADSACGHAHWLQLALARTWLAAAKLAAVAKSWVLWSVFDGKSRCKKDLPHRDQLDLIRI